MLKPIALVLLICAFHATTLIAANAEPGLGITGCPALLNGDRIKLEPKLVGVDFVDSYSMSDSVFARSAVKAQNIASFYENTPEYMKHGAATYNGVSKLDGVSIGQMQWNWDKGKGSLSPEFARQIPVSLINAAPQKLRAELTTIRRYAYGQTSISEANKVIAKWRDYAEKDNSPLHSWLDGKGVRSFQDSLVAKRMEKARKVAETWVRDRKYSADAFEKTLITFANFNIHAGLGPNLTNLRDVWGPQVDLFKASLKNDRNQILKYITNWMRSCKNAHADIRGKADALGWSNGRKGNADIWSASSFVSSLKDYQVDLLSYAFLFATRSKKDNSGKRKPGWVQLDVLNRGGAIILDKGTVRGIAFDWDRY